MTFLPTWSGSKWIDRTADSGVFLVDFGLAATFALFDVEGFSAVPTGADGFGRATLFDLQALTLKDVLISPERAE